MKKVSVIVNFWIFKPLQHTRQVFFEGKHTRQVKTNDQTDSIMNCISLREIPKVLLLITVFTSSRLISGGL